jgi:hypothetical protein
MVIFNIKVCGTNRYYYALKGETDSLKSGHLFAIRMLMRIFVSKIEKGGG